MDTQPPPATDDRDRIYFLADVRPGPGVAAEGGILTRIAGVFRPMTEVKADAATVFDQAAELASAAVAKAPAGFQLDTITFALGFDARGKLGFIADAGITASVEVTFKRP